MTPSTIDLYIGENKETLEALEMEGQVDVVYIDPPYNTGKPIFLYDDKRVDWEDFIYERIRLAHPLMAENGVMLVSINDQELHTLRVIMDRVFGKKNFISTLVWKSNGNSKSRFSRGGIDYVVAYAKDKKLAPEWRERKEYADEMMSIVSKAQAKGFSPQEAQTLLKAYLKKNHQIPKGLVSYSNVDEDYNAFTTASIVNNLYRPNLKYVVTDPATNREYPPPDNGWTISEAKFNELYRDGRIVFKGNRPRKKYLLKDTLYQRPYAHIEEMRSVGHYELERIIGKNRFKNPKNTGVLKKWIDIVSGYKKDAVVMDFFAGSGTTGQAVAELNHQDGGTRSCILVTNNENNIAEDITIPRLTRVLSGDWDDNTIQHDKLPNQLRVYRKEGIV